MGERDGTGGGSIMGGEPAARGVRWASGWIGVLPADRPECSTGDGTDDREKTATGAGSSLPLTVPPAVLGGRGVRPPCGHVGTE
jgi:hypothetical protein